MDKHKILVLLEVIASIALVILLLWVFFPGIFHIFFAWPNGAIWGNIFAEIFLGVGFVYALFHKLDEHHREKIKQAQTHHHELKRLMGHGD